MGHGIFGAGFDKLLGMLAVHVEHTVARADLPTVQLMQMQHPQRRGSGPEGIYCVTNAVGR